MRCAAQRLELECATRLPSETLVGLHAGRRHSSTSTRSGAGLFRYASSAARASFFSAFTSRIDDRPPIGHHRRRRQDRAERLGIEVAAAQRLEVEIARRRIDRRIDQRD